MGINQHSTICFKIENKELYLYKILVWFNDIPLFFVCCDENKKYYLALCADLKKFVYIVSEQSTKNLQQMLSREATMRSVFLGGNSFWLVKSGATIEEDHVESIIKDNLDFEALPPDTLLYQTA